MPSTHLRPTPRTSLRGSGVLRATSLAFVSLLAACAVTDASDDATSQSSAVVVPPNTGPEVSANYAVSQDSFLNPERGFHGNIQLGQDPAFIRQGGHSLARLYIRLDDYRTQEIPSSLLSSIQSTFDGARAAGIKIIPRFTYNFPTTWPNGEQDASRTQVLAHITQLTPVLSKNADVISVMQTGFVGNWGEWHSSTNGLDKDTAAQQAIVSGLLAALPASRSIQIRYPDTITSLFGDPLTPAEAYGGSGKSRTGLQNDCFLAGSDDMGTYGRTNAGVGASAEAGKAFIAQIGQFTPIGGETCAVSAPRSNCDTATTELKQMHYSYLNEDFHDGVNASWKSGGCFDDITQKLGYRFSLKTASHSATAAAGGAMAFKATVSNTGYASPYNPRSAYVVLSGNGNRRVIRIDSDPRRWAPSAETSIDASVVIPADLAPGKYSVALSLPDADTRLEARSEYSIRFANTGVWDAASGDNKLSTQVTITP